MSVAFYYSQEHLDLSEYHGLVGFDLEWYLQNYENYSKSTPMDKRTTLSKFIEDSLKKEIRQ